MLKIFRGVSLKYIGSLIDFMSKDENFIRDLRSFNPFEWLGEKSAFDEGKK